MRLALYQPDIPQNTAAIIRLAVCLGVAVDIIEPCGFVLDDKRMKRVGMDYLGRAALVRHASWERFCAAQDASDAAGRLILLSTSGAVEYTRFAFAGRDTLLLGRESAGVPDEVRAAAEASVRVPMAGGARSLNVALAAAIVLGEALRQTKLLPGGGG
jgi:tRNA (cytidine/uridine-2'-O-)-methyltransferase